MTNQKAIEGLLGETIREIGILVLVFAPLDAAFAEGPFDIPLETVVAARAIGAIVVGIMLETGDSGMHLTAWVFPLLGALVLTAGGFAIRFLRHRATQPRQVGVGVRQS